MKRKKSAPRRNLAPVTVFDFSTQLTTGECLRRLNQANRTRMFGGRRLNVVTVDHRFYLKTRGGRCVGDLAATASGARILARAEIHASELVPFPPWGLPAWLFMLVLWVFIPMLIIMMYFGVNLGSVKLALWLSLLTSPALAVVLVVLWIYHDDDMHDSPASPPDFEKWLYHVLFEFTAEDQTSQSCPNAKNPQGDGGFCGITRGGSAG